MVDLPRRSDSSVKRPAATAGFENGKIPSEHLVGCGLRNRPGGTEWVMVEPAASAMRAMVAAAAADGVQLSASGNPWRSYKEQVSLFLRRYTRTPGSGKAKRFEGRNYWLIPGNAGAATPGKSNHGLGLAADLTRRDWKTRITDHELRWLAAHGPSFGFWNTVASEKWHWTYCLADDVPAGVSKPVGGTVVPPPDTVDWDTIRKLDEQLSAIEYPGLLRRGDKSTAVKAVQWKLHAAGYGIDVDGEIGKNTEAAIKKFEQRNGLPVDGVVDAMVWSRLGLRGGAGGPTPVDGAPDVPDEAPAVDDAPAGTDGAATFTAPLAEGSSGPAVSALQAKLTENGYTVETNGTFGPRTKRAIAHLQEVSKLASTGVVDAVLWKALKLP